MHRYLGVEAVRQIVRSIGYVENTGNKATSGIHFSLRPQQAHPAKPPPPSQQILGLNCNYSASSSVTTLTVDIRRAEGISASDGDWATMSRGLGGGDTS